MNNDRDKSFGAWDEDTSVESSQTTGCRSLSKERVAGRSGDLATRRLD